MQIVLQRRAGREHLCVLRFSPETRSGLVGDDTPGKESSQHIES